jgi:tetratricopeptide (TPR) repeat protein
MSDYPGNPALAAPIKERVNSTFQQALALYRAGRTADVVSGCTLILQMDPLFDPAKKLLEKARNPASPIDIESLAPAAAPSNAGAALQEAREAMKARDFQRVVQITTDVLTNDLMNDEARVLSEEARNKMEAAPFVEQFMKKCEQHLAAGNMAAAQNDLEKAHSLDAAHPSVARMQQMIAKGAARPAAQPAPPPPAAPPSAPAAFSFDSFVVDAPAATGRGTAQASDFGFTFEEEKPAAAPAPPPPAAGQNPGFGSGFSFDAPANSPFSTSGPMPSPIPEGFSFDGPAKQPASGDFDFSTASIETSPADQQKIEQYLAEGDKAFDGGKYQDAIDLWSRVFLIDVTNEQASERIERAKMRRRESESKVDAALNAGVQAFERKDTDTARARFEEALRLDSSNQTAKDYLERLTSRMPMAASAVPPPPKEEKFDIFADEALPMSDEPPSGIYEEPASLAAIPTPKRAAAASPAKTKTAPARQAPIVPIAIVVGLLVFAAIGWFVWSKFVSSPKADPAATQATFSQATQLAQAGKYDQAISVLQDIKPDDPQHDRALVMIGEMQHKKTQAAEMVEGRPASAFYQEQVAAGRSAFESHDYDRAKKAFEQALRVRALPADAKQMYDTASLQSAKLDSAKALFNERKYQDAATNLQQLLQQDPQNQSIRRMILDAHFNLGATALQEERMPDAIKEFDDVLKTDPNDDLAKRSRELAVRYNGQQKDLLYKIYVKYLPLRQAG